MAIFFGVSGGLTAIGPISGGYLAEWTWRAIFWVNIPIALVSLVLHLALEARGERHPARLDYRGAALVTGAMALVVLGLQQSSTWGWGGGRRGCIVAGLGAAASRSCAGSCARRSRCCGWRSSATAASRPRPPSSG